MAEIQDLTATAGSHARWPEGMAPSGVNDSARVDEGIIVRWFGDTNYSLASTVSGTVIQITANRASITLTGTTSNYMADLLMAFTVGSTALAGPNSVNINGIGAIPLRDSNGVSLSATWAHADTRVLITKDNANNYFRLLMPVIPQGGGTWTATDGSGAALSFTTNSGHYVKHGQMVMVSAFITYPATADGSSAIINLPFTAQNTTNHVYGGTVSLSNFGATLHLLVLSNDNKVAIISAAGANVTNAQMSGKTIQFGIVYRAAS